MVMAKSPWFKFYASDFLLDSKVDSLPLEAQAILVRMWAVISIDGKIPDDPKIISRLCRIDQMIYQKHHQNLHQMFYKDDDNFLHSERMERERGSYQRVVDARKFAVECRENKRLTSNDASKPSSKQPSNGSSKTDQSESESDIRTKTLCLELPTEPSKPPVITLPLNDTTEHPIHQEQVSEWVKLYPAVDVGQALRSMRGWLLNNPTKRKTKKGILRFANSWLSNAQDRYSGPLAPSPISTKEPPTLSERLQAMAASGTKQ
jgi:uncharacterized protein YdaU (DUF1376 family)